MLSGKILGGGVEKVKKILPQWPPRIFTKSTTLALKLQRRRKELKNSILTLCSLCALCALSG